MTQIEIFRQKFDKMVDNIPASVDSGAGYVIDEVYKIFDSLQQEQPEVELEKASRNVYESWQGGTMDDFLRDMVELGKALNARKEE